MSKYRKGDRITSLDEMYRQEFIYCGDAVYHCGWFSSWQLHYAKINIDRGIIFYAIENEE